MKPVFQTRFGKEGNCWPACLASMLELPLEETDHCTCSNPRWREDTDALLAKRGLFYVQISKNPDGSFPTTVLPNAAFVILGCSTERNLPHVVIARYVHTAYHPDGQAASFQLWIVHDPIKPEGPSGEYTIDALILLCRLDHD